MSEATEHWPFDQPNNCATFTMRQVMDKAEPILLVTHDENDHGWQFIGSTEASMEDAMLVTLKSIVAIDPSVVEVADLPPGWQAVRSAPGQPWMRRKHPGFSEDER